MITRGSFTLGAIKVGYHLAGLPVPSLGPLFTGNNHKYYLFNLSDNDVIHNELFISDNFTGNNHNKYHLASHGDHFFYFTYNNHNRFNHFTNYNYHHHRLTDHYYHHHLTDHYNHYNYNHYNYNHYHYNHYHHFTYSHSNNRLWYLLGPDH
ncbi:uncharacterized protein PGRI_095600 [Penicillium griseofulvum]|uniref:Uncharacterized protein n=1 Tax=Penicillium patulum TaxID=5078 RepID=A0A135LQW0_PENPA|nr:uncharacterized protein PGRI_095600 [Penicillium griseofulvum]KXG51299.1 hypothetical protein PGRI_095600 [Penicillium griseofulvum]